MLWAYPPCVYLLITLTTCATRYMYGLGCQAANYKHECKHTRTATTLTTTTLVLPQPALTTWTSVCVCPLQSSVFVTGRPNLTLDHTHSGDHVTLWSTNRINSNLTDPLSSCALCTRLMLFKQLTKLCDHINSLLIAFRIKKLLCTKDLQPQHKVNTQNYLLLMVLHKQ